MKIVKRAAFIFVSVMSLTLALILSKPLHAATPTALKFFATSAQSLDSESLLLNGETYRVAAEANRFKVSLVFEKPIALKRLQIESCEGDWHDGIEIFTAPNMQRVFVEGGKSKLQANIGRDPVDAIAIVFGREDKLCLKNFQVIDRNGNALTFSETKVQQVPLEKTKRITALKSVFAKASLERILQSDLLTRQPATANEREKKWIFRLRPDGTFFVRGFSEDINEASEFSALGTFEASIESKNRISIQLQGFRFASGFPWDGISCPYACKSGDLVQKVGVVSDSISFEKLRAGSIMVRNKTLADKRMLPFADQQTEFRTEQD